MTTERLTDLLNGIGLSISKREVVRLLTSDLEAFAQEDRAILQAGLNSSPYITVDDTGARHARRPGVTTQIGGERFCVFRTSRSKSRLNFLSLLRGGREDYVVNEATLDYLRAQSVEAAVIARLTKLQGHAFRSLIWNGWNSWRGVRSRRAGQWCKVLGAPRVGLRRRGRPGRSPEQRHRPPRCA